MHFSSLTRVVDNTLCQNKRHKQQATSSEDGKSFDMCSSFFLLFCHFYKNNRKLLRKIRTGFSSASKPSFISISVYLSCVSLLSIFLLSKWMQFCFRSQAAMRYNKRVGLGCTIQLSIATRYIYCTALPKWKRSDGCNDAEGMRRLTSLDLKGN